MDFKMRKPTLAEIYMYKNIFWLALALALIIPLINAVPLTLITVETSGNYAYPAALSYTVNIIQAVLSFLATYGMLGLLAVCVTYFGKNARGVIVLALISPAVNSLLLYIMVPILDPYAIYDEGARFLVLIIDSLINVLINTIIYFLILKYSGKKNTFMNIPDYRFDATMLRHPFQKAFLIAGGVQLIASVVAECITMVQMFADKSIGLPDNISDYVFWTLQYVYLLIYAVLGYILMVLVGMAFIKLKKNGKEIYSVNLR